MRRLREHAAKARCPSCGRDRVLVPATGRCVLCSRCCRECGRPIRFRDETVCRPCRSEPRSPPRDRPARAAGSPAICASRPGGAARAHDPVRRRTRPGSAALRAGRDVTRGTACVGDAGSVARTGRSSRGETLAARLAEPPDWLDDFVADLAAHYCPAQAASCSPRWRGCSWDEHPESPAGVLERARGPGRSMGPWHVPWRRSSPNTVWRWPPTRPTGLPPGDGSGGSTPPRPMRGAVASFADSMLYARERARRAGTRPRTDHTIETALTIVRDLARFLDSSTRQTGLGPGRHARHRGVPRRPCPKHRTRRLTVLRQFFRFARSRKFMLVDPTPVCRSSGPEGSVAAPSPRTSSAPCFAAGATTRDAHPHEALLGILALLHGASSDEVRHCASIDIDADERVDPARQPSPPGAAGPGQLEGAAALPRPPRGPAHRQPARDRHQGHQGRADDRPRRPT